MTAWRDGLGSSTVCLGGAVITIGGLLVPGPAIHPDGGDVGSDHGRDGCACSGRGACGPGMR